MNDNLRGILLMILSMGVFSIEDSMIKLMSRALPTGQIIAMIGFGGAVVFMLWAARMGHRVFTPALMTWPLLLRLIGESFGTIFFVLALKHADLSLATAIFQVNPIVVTLAAALFLGERVGWRRWLAIITGFIGVLIIIRPGAEAFEPASLYALITVFGLALRDIATRACPRDIPTLALSAQGMLILIPTGLILLAFDGPPVALDQTQGIYALAAVVAVVIAYHTLLMSLRTGEMGVVTPFRYSRLLFGMSIGMLFFAERPDTATFIGAAVVVASGVYTILRERAVNRRARHGR